jgi:thiol-disulfide isomerase/thioredoxin
MTQPTPRSRKPLVMILIIAGVFILGAALMPLLINFQTAALQGGGIDLPPVRLSKAAPALSLTDLAGKSVSLADYRGRTVLVNNWATWCPPCQAEMPELQAYYDAHAADGFILVAIESGEPARTVQDFVLKNKMTFPVWLDPGGLALGAFKNWDLPSSYVIDGNGNMLLSWTGPVDQASLEKYVTPLLEK